MIAKLPIETNKKSFNYSKIQILLFNCIFFHFGQRKQAKNEPENKQQIYL